MTDIILYPTDTLYGLGVDATDAEAVAALRALKGSGVEKHISIVVSDIDMMRQYAEVTPLAEKLAKAFFPGKLTIILQGKNLPKELSEDMTIGFRIPNHPAPIHLVTELGKPITATSANISGMQNMKTTEEILAQFGGDASKITRVINVGVLPESLPSTVVDARGSEPIVIREGAITTLAIQQAVV
jgi:L-threonylcarbamoyladenylate synthase